MVIFSILLLISLSYYKFNTLRNPVFYFIILHYFHNFSFSILKNYDFDIFWRADLSVNFNTMDEIVFFNTISLYITSFILLFFIKKKDNFININLSKFHNKYCLYIYYAFSAIIILTNLDLISGNIIYGSNQALTSSSSFDPLVRLWHFRIFFILYYIIFNKISFRRLLFIISFEFLMSFLILERKDLTMVLFGATMLLLNQINFRIKLKHVFMSFLVFIGVIILPIYRSFTEETGFLNKMNLSIDFIFESRDIIIYYASGFVNSEGVQNWTLQLINDGSLKLLNGLSYLQGIVNTVIFRPLQPDWLVNSQASYYFKNIAYPKVTNHGYDFSFTAEAILNFGINGGYLAYIILSFYIVSIYKNKSRIWIFQRILIWPILFISFRTDSTAFFRILSYVYFTTIIIKFINSFINVRNRRTT